MTLFYSLAGRTTIFKSVNYCWILFYRLKTGDILFITPKSGTSSKISSAEDNDDVEVESAGEEINLTAAECQKRIDSFIEVTKTDEAFAQSVLQDHDWNLETALNAFLVSNVPSDGTKEEDDNSKKRGASNYFNFA